MAIHTETERYKLETMGNGLFALLTRKADGASLHAQGDDAAIIVNAADELSKLLADNEPRFVEVFNHWASQYDDVMTKEGE